MGITCMHVAMWISRSKMINYLATVIEGILSGPWEAREGQILSIHIRQQHRIFLPTHTNCTSFTKNTYRLSKRGK
jgi:hypothetical protein